MKKLAVLVSEQGSVLNAILEQKLPVAVVASDRTCPALAVAKKANVPVIILDRIFGDGFNRDAFTLDLLYHLRRFDVDLVAMAGFRTILSAFAFEWFPGKILNTHPSLLPAFPGSHAVRDALAYGVKLTGCTVHIATPELDLGPILAQAAVRVADGDTVETLHERIKDRERALYPQVIRTQLN